MYLCQLVVGKLVVLVVENLVLGVVVVVVVHILEVVELPMEVEGL
jgi:hypothetical protein